VATTPPTRILIFLIFFQQCRFVVLTTVIHSDDVYSVGIYIESDNDALSIAGNPQPGRISSRLMPRGVKVRRLSQYVTMESV
jgi:hypothetical protein